MEPAPIIAPAYGGTAEDCGVCADCGASLDEGRSEFLLALYKSPGIINIGEDTGWTAEDFFLYGDARVDRYVVLKLAAVPYGNIRADHAVLPDDALSADFGPAEDMAKIPYFCAFTDFNIIIDVTG